MKTLGYVFLSVSMFILISILDMNLHGNTLNEILFYVRLAVQSIILLGSIGIIISSKALEIQKDTRNLFIFSMIPSSMYLIMIVFLFHALQGGIH